MVHGVPPATCALAGGMCGLAGVLPDLDIGSGIPRRGLLSLVAAVVPVLLVNHLAALQLPLASIGLAVVAAYLVARFGIAHMLDRITTHRGMFHSLPAAIIAGEVVFLVASDASLAMRTFLAIAVTLGYFSHLVLDELAAIEWHRGFFRVKKSFGTAMKMFGHNVLGNVVAYGLMLGLGYMVSEEVPINLTTLHHQRHRSVVDQLDLHVLAKPPSGHGNAAGRNGGDEHFVQLLGQLGRRGGDETRTPALAAVAQ